MLYRWFLLYVVFEVYIFQFVYLYHLCWLVRLVLKSFVFIIDILGLSIRAPLTSGICAIYFSIMFFMCYSGHFSWCLACARTIDFIFLWAVVGCVMATIIAFQQIITFGVIGVGGEGYLGMLYGI